MSRLLLGLDNWCSSKRSTKMHCSWRPARACLRVAPLRSVGSHRLTAVQHGAPRLSARWYRMGCCGARMPQQTNIWHHRAVAQRAKDAITGLWERVWLGCRAAAVDCAASDVSVFPPHPTSQCARRMAGPRKVQNQIGVGGPHKTATCGVSTRQEREVIEGGLAQSPPIRAACAWYALGLRRRSAPST